MVKTNKKEVKESSFSSTREFFRHLVRLWNTKKLARELRQSKKEFEQGKGKVLRSLKDLQ